MASPFQKKSLTDDALDSMRINLAVNPRKLLPEPCCDICGGPLPVVVYASHRMTTGQEIDCWRWACCHACEVLIDAEDWQGITTRAVTALHWLMPTLPKWYAQMGVQRILLDLQEHIIRNNIPTNL